jgi:hypothetical protein
VKLKAPYLLFPVAIIGSLCFLVSVHLLYKPAGLAWAYYDPGFVYALNETPSELGEYSCRPNTVFGVGSSTFDSAVAKASGQWLRWNQWRRYRGPLGKSKQVTAVVRTATRDLRMLHPVLSLLPDCKKVVLIDVSLFLSQEGNDVFSPDYLKNLLLTTPQHFLSAGVERYFPKKYQLKFHVRMKHRKSRLDKSKRRPIFFVAEKHKNSLRANTKALNSEHIQILDELIANQAQVVLLDIAKSPEMEEGYAQGFAHYRQVLESYASTDSALHYWHYPSQDIRHYVDGSHMNARGARFFRRWLAGKVEQLGEGGHGLR